MRIGGVPFGVGAPLIAGLPAAATALGIPLELHRAAPTALIEELRAGRLDAALVSSVEAFRRPGYTAPAELGIACDGPVRSVRAFVRPGQTPRTAAADRGSAASVALLQVLLARLLHAEPTWTTIEPTLRPDDRPEDLVLLIGDAGRDADPGAREVLDLGALWHDWTGLPFVFALWLIAPQADAPAVARLLRQARAHARRSRIPDGTGGAVHYELGAREHAGLARFHTEAAALRLCEAAIRPTFLEPEKTTDELADA